MAAGEAFCHWEGHEPARVMIVDGEMSIELVKERLADAARRLGMKPPTLFTVCKEDASQMPPLDTEAGQRWLDGLIEHVGGVDFIILDNIMSLTVGDMKEEVPWRPVTAWMRSLTKRRIGCLWITHTGHDSTKTYGTKTREWQLDVAMIGEKVEDSGADIAMRLTFTKARQRTPANRADFETVTLTLKEDRWEAVTATKGKNKKSLSARATTGLDKLRDLIARSGQPAPTSDHIPPRATVVTLDAWRKHLQATGVIDSDPTTSTSRTAFFKIKDELVDAGRVAIWGMHVWLA